MSKIVTITNEEPKPEDEWIITETCIRLVLCGLLNQDKAVTEHFDGILYNATVGGGFGDEGCNRKSSPDQYQRIVKDPTISIQVLEKMLAQHQDVNRHGGKNSVPR